MAASDAQIPTKLDLEVFNITAPPNKFGGYGLIYFNILFEQSTEGVSQSLYKFSQFWNIFQGWFDFKTRI
jgi:hypothetical protein